MRSFRSDNNSGLCREAAEAIAELVQAGDHEIGYGDGRHTDAARSEFRRLFGERTEAFFVPTGTAANGIAIGALTRPWQKVICHVTSHWWTDESTAPEALTGCRSVAIGTPGMKLTADELSAALEDGRGSVHEPAPGVVTITNPTESGQVYTPDEIAELASRARAKGYRVHLDGARFGNAVARLGCSPRALTVDAGVDVLSFGAAKNGLALGEAIVFFPREDDDDVARAAAETPFRIKASGHLVSKMRFLTAPLAAVLRGDAWIRHAAHANAMAARLAAGLSELGISPLFPVEANTVFVVLPPAVDEAARAAGHGYYAVGPAALGLVRLVASFDTTEEDVDGFLAIARRALR